MVIKLLRSLKEALKKAGLKDGMTISTHHHLRNGDALTNTNCLMLLKRLGSEEYKMVSQRFVPGARTFDYNTWRTALFIILKEV
jgi:citrate lyase alpha subunit